jgi:superfamily I DNA/RNA helicase
MDPIQKETMILERKSYLDRIISSESRKKIIVAGPGTGKTYTFSKLFESKGKGKFLALTFIRNLAKSLALELGKDVETRTFHSYCKGVLHEQLGMVSIFPNLTAIIEYDASILKPKLSDFKSKFQNLEEGSEEIKFFLDRGNYYKWLSFEDSVYRLYTILKEDKSILPSYDQIVIDEFQDFNALEVEFLNQLESQGPVLIVGDDDQALYTSLKHASPAYIRDKFNSGVYDRFELPFCSRCPEVIVNLTNSFIDQVKRGNRFQSRIEREFRSFLPDIEDVSKKYNKVIYVELALIKSIVKYLKLAIENIATEEIVESYEKNYPNVLILGSTHYLKQIHKGLSKYFSGLELIESDKSQHISLVDAYAILLDDNNSNLGWRILCEVLLGLTILTDAINRSTNGENFQDFLDPTIIDNHKACLKSIRLGIETHLTVAEVKSQIYPTLGSNTDSIIKYFFDKVEEKEIQSKDATQPKIVLTTYVGSKGLSGGHVFITGFWNGELPKLGIKGGKPFVDDVEISKFIVALTRTRKQCHLIYNKWMIQPKTKNGKFDPPKAQSSFLHILNDEFIEHLGFLNSEGMEKYFSK